jgi:hypothetical protein
MGDVTRAVEGSHRTRHNVQEHELTDSPKSVVHESRPAC